MSAELAARIRARIEHGGPITVPNFVDAALYDPLDGFYARGGQAGRRGDFLTAPEVGPLFGAVISNAVDAWWDRAGRPERFVVAEHGAGPGTLARTVTLAAGSCLSAGALEWIMVESSDEQRRTHPDGPHLRSISSGDDLDRVDVVFANELLDNLPFDIVTRRTDGWRRRRIDVDVDGFVLVDGELVEAPPGADSAAADTDLPLARGAAGWIEAQRLAYPTARLVAFDYAASTVDLIARGGEWLRAYQRHQRIGDWLTAPGTCDITIDLPIEQLAAESTRIQTQADFLGQYGIVDLVAEGQRTWNERSTVGDLAALRARSRATEAEALLDPQGMGAFTVFEWIPAAQ